MKLRLVVAGICAAVAASEVAAGEVVDKTAEGFLVRHVVTVAAPPAAAYAGIVNVGQWWSSAHTYSGSAKNMSMVAKAGGCFCEKLADGEVQHGMVVFAQTGKVLRLTGALGPMQASGIAGTLTFALKPSGTGTEITLTYSAGGYMQGGIGQIAAPADGMLAEQVAGLKKYLDSPAK